MAYPTVYNVTYSYTNFAVGLGNGSFPGTQLDNDLAGLESSINSVDLFMQSVLRSDGALNNGIVTYDSLSPSLQTAGLAPAVPWVTATAWAIGNSVVQSGNLYRCLIPHTSGVFATDLAAGDWLFITALPAGPQGLAATIAIHSTTTLGAGASATVVNAGTAQAASLDFGIPQGIQGIQGVTGPAAWLPSVAWLTAQNYVSGPPATTVVQAGETYLCLTPHTSGVFATDLGAGKWIKVAAKGTGDLLSTNNLSDVTAKYTAKDNLTIHGADIASASTVNLETATGDLVDVTGTTTITAITLSDGHERDVRFTGALILTNGASLVLPGGANITTAAGDYAVFRGYAAGVVRCTRFSRLSGKPIVANTPTEVGAAALAGNQNLTGGFTATSQSDGTKSSGTYTPDPLTGNFKHITANGAFTLAPPSTPSTMVVEVLNGAAAGAITTSGFTRVIGDTYATTNANKYAFHILKTQNYSRLFIEALQ